MPDAFNETAKRYKETFALCEGLSQEIAEIEDTLNDIGFKKLVYTLNLSWHPIGTRKKYRICWHPAEAGWLSDIDRINGDGNKVRVLAEAPHSIRLQAFKQMPEFREKLTAAMAEIIGENT